MDRTFNPPVSFSQINQANKAHTHTHAGRSSLLNRLAFSEMEKMTDFLFGGGEEAPRADGFMIGYSLRYSKEPTYRATTAH